MSDVLVCPHCGAYVMTDNDLCPRCDQPLHEPPADPESVREADAGSGDDAHAALPPNRADLPTDVLPDVRVTEPGREPESDPESVSESDSESEPVSESEFESSAESSAEPGVDPRVEPGVEPAGEVDSESETGPDADWKPELEPDAEPESALEQDEPAVEPGSTQEHAADAEPESVSSFDPDETLNRSRDDLLAVDSDAPPVSGGEADAAPESAESADDTLAGVPPVESDLAIPPAPFVPPPVRAMPPPPAATATPPYPMPSYAAPYAQQHGAVEYLQQRIHAYTRGGYKVITRAPHEATLARGKGLSIGAWILALLTLIGFFWYVLVLVLGGFQRDVVYLVLEPDGRVYEDGPGAAHVRGARSRTGRRWSIFGLVILVVSLLLGVVLGVVAGVVLTQERYQAALREAYPAVTLFEERFSPAEATPDDVQLAKDGAVVFAILGGIAAVGLWGGATLFVIGAIHASAYRVSVPPLPGYA